MVRFYVVFVRRNGVYSTVFLSLSRVSAYRFAIDLRQREDKRRAAVLRGCRCVVESVDAVFVSAVEIDGDNYTTSPVEI